MKYQEVLQERGLNVENLSKVLQGQIATLEQNYSEDLDEKVANKILKFNPETQLKREAAMKAAIDARMKKQEQEIVEHKKPKNNVSVKQKLDDIKKDIQEKPIVQQATTIQPLEQDEFEKVQSVKKKRNGLWFGLIGVGALALTWGAVNLFKNKR